jgi:hypothetical protein
VTTDEVCDCVFYCLYVYTWFNLFVAHFIR